MIQMFNDEYENWAKRQNEEILNDLTATYVGDEADAASGIRTVVLLGYFDSRFHNDGCFGFFDNDYIYPQTGRAERTKEAASEVGCEFLLPMIDLGVQLRCGGSLEDSESDPNELWDAMDDEYAKRRGELVEAVGAFFRTRKQLFVGE